MSIITILKNNFGKRSRDTDEVPPDQDSARRIKVTKETYIPAPRRRSSHPGAFPDTGEYSAANVHAQSKDKKKATTKSKTVELPTSSKDHTKAAIKSKTGEDPTTVIAVVSPEETAAITPTEETTAYTPTAKKPTPKYKPATRATRDSSQNVRVSKKQRAAKMPARQARAQAPIEMTSRHSFPKRRRSELNQPYATSISTSHDRARKRSRYDAAPEQLPTPSPSPPRSIKEFLADPSTRIAKAHKAAQDAHAKSEKINKEVEHLRKTAKNNIFSRAQIKKQEDGLEPVTEAAAGTSTSTEPKGCNKNDSDGTASPDLRDKSLTEEATNTRTSHESAEIGNKNDTAGNASSDQSNTPVQSQSESPASPNENSGDDVTSISPSTKTNTSHNNVDPTMSAATSIATAVAAAFSTHLATQNETLAAQNESIAKKMEEVSKALAQTNAKNLEAQQLITRLATQPPSHAIQPQIIIRTEPLEQVTDRKVTEPHEANLEVKDIWASQKQQLANGHCSTPPLKDYFDPRSSLRRNRVVLPMETSRPILEAHEVQYHYQLEACPVQKALGFPRKQETLVHASLKNRMAEPSTPDQAMPMEFEATGPPAVIKTWKPDQAIVFGQGTQHGLNNNMGFAAPRLPSSVPPADPAKLRALEAGLDEILRRGPRASAPRVDNRVDQAALEAGIDAILRRGPRNGPPIDDERDGSFNNFRQSRPRWGGAATHEEELEQEKEKEPVVVKSGGVIPTEAELVEEML